MVRLADHVRHEDVAACLTSPRPGHGEEGAVTLDASKRSIAAPTTRGKTTRKASRPQFVANMPVKVKDRRPYWTGTAIALKPSPVSGWWFDVRNADNDVWTVHASKIERIK
jgi:hypothetical protein